MLAFTACKDSGSVGQNLGDPGSNFSIDTMNITGIRAIPLNAFSGGLQYISAGEYDDPAFGDVKAFGYIKPLLASSGDSAIFRNNPQLTLKLAINQSTDYGDTLATQRFDVMEVGQLFRGPSARIKNVLKLNTQPLVASFSVEANSDTVYVPLGKQWTQKYSDLINPGSANRDSLYALNLYGLALVPQNAGKIVTFSPSNSRLIATAAVADTAQSDSVSISIGNYAFSIARQDTQSISPDNLPVFSTLEKALTFNYDFSSKNIEPINVAKAELVIERDNLLLNGKPAQVARPDAQNLLLHFVKGDELPQSLDPGSPIARGIYDSSDDAYHFNLTGPIKGGQFDSADSTFSFYMTLGSNNGVIQSSLLFNNQAGSEGPKLIISYIKNR